jgi:NADH:ubiquinone oxidoreductase subunit 6 (subunit J)
MNSLRKTLAGLFLALLVSLLMTPLPWRALPQGVESFLGIGQAIFNQYLLPFEALSILLLAALIGALLLAKKEGE